MASKVSSLQVGLTNIPPTPCSQIHLCQFELCTANGLVTFHTMRTWHYDACVDKPRNAWHSISEGLAEKVNGNSWKLANEVGAEPRQPRGQSGPVTWHNSEEYNFGPFFLLEHCLPSVGTQTLSTLHCSAPGGCDVHQISPDSTTSSAPLLKKFEQSAAGLENRQWWLPQRWEMSQRSRHVKTWSYDPVGMLLWAAVWLGAENHWLVTAPLNVCSMVHHSKQNTIIHVSLAISGNLISLYMWSSFVVLARGGGIGSPVARPTSRSNIPYTQ